MMLREKEKDTMLEDTYEVVNIGLSLNKRGRDTILWQKLENQDHREDPLSSSFMEEEEEHASYFMKTQIYHQ